MIVRGVRQVHEYTDALSKFIEPKAKEINYTIEELFNKYDLLSTREASEMMDVYFTEDMADQLEEYVKSGFLEKIKVKDGWYWKKK